MPKEIDNWPQIVRMGIEEALVAGGVDSLSKPKSISKLLPKGSKRWFNFGTSALVLASALISASLIFDGYNYIRHYKQESDLRQQRAIAVADLNYSFKTNPDEWGKTYSLYLQSPSQLNPIRHNIAGLEIATGVAIAATGLFVGFYTNILKNPQHPKRIPASTRA